VEDDSAQAAVACLRVRLQHAFQAWCHKGGRNLPPVLRDALAVITDIFSIEGATGSEVQQRRWSVRCADVPHVSLPAHMLSCARCLMMLTFLPSYLDMLQARRCVTCVARSHLHSDLEAMHHTCINLTSHIFTTNGKAKGRARTRIANGLHS
jgi:hypothetical protein